MRFFKIALISLFLAGIPHVSGAQEISNGSFESWYIDGLYQYPIGWTSSNDFSLPIGPAGVSADSSSYEGLLAAKIITTNIGFAGAPYAGFIVNGSMNVTGHYDIDSIHKAGEPFSYRPDALSGYYKYSSDALIEDWGHAFVLLKRYDSINKRIDTIGFGSNTLLNPSKDYKYFQVEIEYYKSGINPDSVVVAFFSTYPVNPIGGGKLWIDNLSFDYATLVGGEIHSNLLNIYPNPVTSTLRLTGPRAAKVKIYNTSSKVVLHITGGESIMVSNLPVGVYFLTAEIDKQWYCRKFIKK